MFNATVSCLCTGTIRGGATITSPGGGGGGGVAVVGTGMFFGTIMVMTILVTDMVDTGTNGPISCIGGSRVGNRLLMTGAVFGGRSNCLLHRLHCACACSGRGHMIYGRTTG